jgi:hypothetical protein
MKVLTPDDVDHFLEKGFVRLRGCFTHEAAREYTRHLWDRLGYRPDDPSTWEQPSVHMESHLDIDVEEFAPKAYWAACDLVGDVYLLHPFVLHAKSQNIPRRPRIITNSTLFLAEPMRFNRPNLDDHSPVERAVLRALGVDRYDFAATGPRERVST